MNSNFVTPAEPGDNTSALMRRILAEPEWRDMYFRRLRTLVNDLLATGGWRRSTTRRSARPSRPRPSTTPPGPTPAARNYATFRHRLFSDIQARRPSSRTTRGCRATSRPRRIVIDEIQHSPTGGDTREFVELYNPGTQAIDLSGWTHLRRRQPDRSSRAR